MLSFFVYFLQKHEQCYLAVFLLSINMLTLQVLTVNIVNIKVNK